MNRTELQLGQGTAHEFALCDATLTGVCWSADGRDFMLDLRHGDGRLASLRCEWAAGVRIDLGAEPDALGGPLLWECRWKEVSGGWRMSMEFASRGTVELDCQRAVLVYDVG